MLSGYYTMGDAAREAGVIESTIRRAVIEGRLQCEMVGNKKLIPELALQHYKAEQGHRNGANAKKAKQ